MSRTAPVLLAVAALVALAGCGGALPGGDAAPNPDADLERADPLYDTPLEGSDLLAGHEAALRDAETVTVVRNTTITGTGPGAGFESQTTARVSLADGRVYLVERPAPVTQTYRYANDTAFSRSASGNSCSRVENDTEGRTAVEWTRAPLERFLPLASFTHRGVAERDGERVHVYRATDTAAVNVSTVTPGDSTGVELTAVNVTLRVRESGAVSHLQFAYTVEDGDKRREVTASVTFSDLGETNVSPPAWVADLRERLADDE